MSFPARKRIAVIGAGISGVSFARMAADHADVVVFEQAQRIGGLIRCDWIDGRLFHRVGGHVFNTKDDAIRAWFWSHFDREKEFVEAHRQAAIWLDGRQVDYPIENHLHQLPAAAVESIVGDLLDRVGRPPARGRCADFREFLVESFGPTLFELYFRPYNEKIWRTDLAAIPLAWLEGKLPMPDVREIFTQGILRRGEERMVHSTFFYPRRGGSQFIIDRLAQGIEVHLGTPVEQLKSVAGGVEVNGGRFDAAVYCGDIRRLGALVADATPAVVSALQGARDLRANGTSNLFCECDATELTWLYLPGAETRAHRIIHTGSLSAENNGASPAGRATCVVEFSGAVERAEMEAEAARLPGNLRPLAHNHEAASYILHDFATQSAVAAARAALAPRGIHLLGRFAEWEYYNMDKCMEGAARLTQEFLS